MDEQAQAVANADESGGATPKTYSESYVKELRGEAAANRVAAKEAKLRADALQEQVEQLTSLKTQLADLQKLVADEQAARKTLEINAARTSAAQKHGLPEALAARLQGNTPEEIAADAAKLAEVLPGRSAQPIITSPSNPVDTGKSDPTMAQRILTRIEQGRSAFDVDWAIANGGGVIRNAG